MQLYNNNFHKTLQFKNAQTIQFQMNQNEVIILIKNPNSSNTPPQSSQQVQSPTSQISEGAFTQFCAIWKTQLSIPVIAYEKVLKILQEYNQLKPQLQKKQKQLQILLNYNSKSLECIQKFRLHEKRILDRCNSLTKLYVKTFKKYFENKNMPFDQTLFKQIPSMFQKFSMKEWQVQPEQIEKPKVNLKYKQYLYRIMKQYYITPSINLEELLNKKSKQSQTTKSQIKCILKLQEQVKQFNKIAQNVTIENMFDVYEKRKKIQQQIKYLRLQNQLIQYQNQQRKNSKDKYSIKKQYKSFNQIDEDFVSAVKRLHADMQDISPTRLKQYVQNQHEYRIRIKKKQLRQKKKFQNYYGNLKQQISDLKQQIQPLKKKIIDLQKLNSQYKAQIQYMNIKSSMNRRNNNSSRDISLVYDDSPIFGDKLGGKKDKENIKRLELEVKKLEEIIKNKQKQTKNIISNGDLTQMKKNMDQIFNKFSSFKKALDIDASRDLAKSGQSVVKINTSTGTFLQYEHNFNNVLNSFENIVEDIKNKIKDLKNLAEQFWKIFVTKQMKINFQNDSNIYKRKSQDQNVSVAPSISPQLLYMLEGSYLNKTQIIQPPNISNHSKEINFSDDSSSMKNYSNALVKQKQKQNIKTTKYKDLTLRISSPKVNDQAKKAQSIDLGYYNQNDSPLFSGFLQMNYPQTPVSINSQMPLFLNPIEQQSKGQDSKLQRNDSDIHHSKFKGDSLKQSASLKQTAQFAHNNQQSYNKSRKSSDSAINHINSAQLQSFNGRILEQSQDQKNSSSRKQSKLTSMQLQLKMRKSHSSKTQKQVPKRQRNRLQITNLQGYNLGPILRTENILIDSKQQSSKSIDKLPSQQISLNRSLILEARCKQLQNLIIIKQNQNQKLIKQIQQLKLNIKDFNFQRQKLGSHQILIQNKDGNEVKSKKINDKLQQIRQKFDKLIQVFYETQNQINLVQSQDSIKHIQQIFKILYFINLQAKNNQSQLIKSQEFKNQKHEFDSFYSFIIKQIKQQHPQKDHQKLFSKISTKILRKQSLPLNLSQDKTKYQKSKQKNQNSSKIFKKQAQIEIAKKYQTNKQVNKIYNQNQSIPKTIQIKTEQNQTLKNKQNSFEPSLDGSISKSKSLKQRQIKQGSNQQSFNTPTEDYLAKIQQQNKVNSFRDDSNNLSISIVKDSNKIIRLSEGSGQNDQKNINQNLNQENKIIVAGLIDSENSSQNILAQDNLIKQSLHEIKVKKQTQRDLQNKQLVKQSIIKKNQNMVSNSQNLSRNKNSSTQLLGMKNSLAPNQTIKLNLNKQQGQLPFQSSSDLSISVTQIKHSNRLHKDAQKNSSNRNQKKYDNSSSSSVSSDQNTENAQITPISESNIATQSNLKISNPLYNENHININVKSVEKQIKFEQKFQKERNPSTKERQNQKQTKKQIDFKLYDQKKQKQKENKGQINNNRIRKSVSRCSNTSKQSQNSIKNTSIKKSYDIKTSKKHQNKDFSYQIYPSSLKSSPYNNQQQYNQLIHQYKILQKCLIQQTQRNNKKQLQYQSYLKQIKMTIKPYSKLGLEQRLFESQKYIKQLQNKLFLQEKKYQKDIMKYVEESQRLCQRYLVMLDKNLAEKRTQKVIK